MCSNTKHHLSENENNMLTITGPESLTTACFEFQGKGDVNVFTAHFPQCGVQCRLARRGGGRGGSSAG